MFDGKGHLVICEMSNNRVTRDNLNGSIIVLADSYKGKKLHMPNDLWIDPKGGIYFSDFTGQRDNQEEKLQVYYISHVYKSVKQVTDDLVAPNGLIGAPDGKTLYITDPGAGKTWSYKINPDGTLKDKKLFCSQATDGMAMDEKNNVYFSDGSIFSPTGKLIEEIAFPERGANLTFRGKDRKTLFITAGSSVYTLEMAVKGAPTALDLASGGKNSGLIASGATLKMMQSGFQGTEGPATDADGNVYFTDVFDEKIYKWTWKDGRVTLIRENTGMANGMMFDSQGRLVVYEMANKRVTRDDLKGNITVLADSCDGKKLHNPNDLWIDTKGGIYFSHQYFPLATGGMPGRGAQGGMPGGSPGGQQAGGGMPGPPQGEGGGISWEIPDSVDTSELGILYISPDGKKVTRVTADVTGPNGLIGTPDGKILYVGDQGKIWLYTINPDGTLSDKKLFCEKNTDGMAMDEKNNVYITAGNYVLIYSPSGDLLEEITMPEGCSNVEFCGKDRKTLFITYCGYLYTLDMAVRGSQLPIDLAKGKK
jgi:gluconolactonase